MKKSEFAMLLSGILVTQSWVAYAASGKVSPTVFYVLAWMAAVLAVPQMIMAIVYQLKENQTGTRTPWQPLRDPSGPEVYNPQAPCQIPGCVFRDYPELQRPDDPGSGAKALDWSDIIRKLVVGIIVVLVAIVAVISALMLR